MKIDTLGRGELQDLMRRVSQLERASPLSHASIGRNGLRVRDGGVITIENGGLKVTGEAEVIGELIGSGTLTWSGPVTVNGVTVLAGNTTITGDVSVTGGGKIDLGGLSLVPTGAGSGAINFHPTGGISAGFGNITLVSPDLTTVVVIGDGEMTVNGVPV